MFLFTLQRTCSDVCVRVCVRRFHVQRYNADSLMACALPHHDSNVFVRVLQLLDVREQSQNRRWHWLRPLQVRTT